MMQTEIDLARELASETVAQLADTRRRRKAKEAERDADESLKAAKALVEELEAPFGVADLAAEEKLLADLARDVLVDFDTARKAELLAGRECAKLACPEGVRVQWTEKALVPDANQLPLGFQKVAPKTKEILAALKKGQAVKGASLVVQPTVVVTGDEEPATESEEG